MVVCMIGRMVVRMVVRIDERIVGLMLASSKNAGD
jgi:hypothetical protein